MQRRGRRVAALAVAAVLIFGAMSSLARKAVGAEVTIPECLAAYEDSVRLRKNHQLLATLGKLAICSSGSCPTDIRAECLGRARDIEASMPTVVFEARDTAGNSLPAVKVTMDGNVLV